MKAGTAHISVGPVVTRADVPGLCAALAELLRDRAGGLVVCDAGAVRRPDVATVEALIRLRQTARRHGRRLTLAGAGPELLTLVALLGLGDLLPEAGREPEQREQPGGVEEVVHPRDAAAG